MNLVLKDQKQWRCEMKVNWKSPESFLADWEEDAPNKAIIYSSSMKKWVNNEVRSMVGADHYKEIIRLFTVEDYTFDVPAGFKAINQIAYGFPEHNPKCTKKEVVKWVTENYETGCKIKVDVECPKCQRTDCNHEEMLARIDINEFEMAAHPEWMMRKNKSLLSYGDISGGYKSCGYHPGFLLMHPTQNNFFGINYHIKGCVNLSVDSVVEYTLELPKIRLNIPKCKVLMSFMSYYTDPKGYLMIPDLPEVWDALKFHVDSKLAYIQWGKTKSAQDERYYDKLSRLRDEKKLIAEIIINRLSTPELKHLWQNYFGKMIPNYYAEESFYGETNDTYKTYM